MNITLLEYKVKKYAKKAKKAKTDRKRKKMISISEEFQDCLNVVTGKAEGYLQNPKNRKTISR